MKFIKSNQYNKEFLMQNMMGPNCMKILEELTETIKLEKGMRVLDLGCGKGLTSIFLAKEFGVNVFATDLWIGATENHHRFQVFNLEKQIIPIHADAWKMPYADEYFDAVICIDAYLYFGGDERFMDDKLAPLLKKDGLIAIAIPGMKKEIHDSIPQEMLLSWSPEDIKTIHSSQWWQELLGKSHQIKIDSIQEMQCFDECWSDWLACDHEYAKIDRPAMEAGAGKYMNFISIIARKI